MASEREVGQTRPHRADQRAIGVRAVLLGRLIEFVEVEDLKMLDRLSQMPHLDDIDRPIHWAASDD